MGKPKDITGQRFGRLVAIKNTGEKRGPAYLWLFKCDCGNEKIICIGDATKGTTKSCGCLGSETHKEMIKISHQSLRENDWKENTSLSAIGNRMLKNNTSGVKGVSWNKRFNNWETYITFQGKRIYLGRFKNKQDAIKARKEAEEKYFKPILEKYGKTQ